MSHLSMLHLSPATAAALPATLAALPLPALLAYSVELFMMLSHAQVCVRVFGRRADGWLGCSQVSQVWTTWRHL